QYLRLRCHDDVEVGLAVLTAERRLGGARNLRQTRQNELALLARQSRHQRTNWSVPAREWIVQVVHWHRGDEVAHLALHFLALSLRFDRDRAQRGLGRGWGRGPRRRFGLLTQNRGRQRKRHG